MARQFKVLKDGIYQRLSDGTTGRPQIGDIIEMSDIAADTHLIPEGYVVEVSSTGEEFPTIEEASEDEVNHG